MFELSTSRTQNRIGPQIEGGCIESRPWLKVCNPCSGFGWRFLQYLGTEVAEAAGIENHAECRRTPKMARLEAALFVADGALSTQKLAQLATLSDTAETRTLIEKLNAAYDRGGSAFRIERVAAGYQMLTRPDFAPWLNKLHQRQSEWKLSPPALETLTIVAYRQPITRAEIEAVRGVQCTEMLKQLMDRGLVRIAGEEDSLGRPYLYETTRKFLQMFGLRTLGNLPMADRLRHSNLKDDANLEV